MFHLALIYFALINVSRKLFCRCLILMHINAIVVNPLTELEDIG